MIARDFALYDILDCAATAIDEAESGRPALAEAAWLEACLAASGLFAPGSRANAAVGVIIGASGPACNGGQGRAALWNALDAASLAALIAIGEDRELPGMAWHAALAAAGLLPPERRDALTVILGEIRRTAGAGSEVTAQ